ncbi:sulfatase [Bacteroidia bacterium]|nr:sulfatase [Bacteroidia bacterium]
MGRDIAWSFVHGAHMDASFTGYSLLLIAVFIALVAPFTSQVAKGLTAFIAYPLLIIISILTVIDVVLFGHWGCRLDTTPLQYLTHPKEILLGSLSAIHTLLLLAAVIVWTWLWTRLFAKKVMAVFPQKRLAWRHILSFLFIAALCIIPIRGSFGTAPMNHGMVFFSKNSLVNQATLNMPWNLMYALTHQDRSKSYKFMTEDEAHRLAQPYFSSLADSSIHHPQFIIHQPCNVLIIILESAGANLIACAGGESGLSPCFDSLAGEGILFPHVYASGHRTERGVLAALSGYPSQTTNSVMRVDKKMRKLPALSRDFAQQNYNTAFFYGGDISFVNMRSYVLETGFNRYTSVADFASKQQSSKWGAHDEFLYARTFAELDTMRKPFFAAVLTLSNHEPYEVPMTPVIKGTADDAMRNAMVYADRCLGDFVAQCKQKTWWDSTLVVLVADHGKVMPPTARYDTATIRIPMLWLGGALGGTAKRVNKIASQHDLAATLLRQLSMPTAHYLFSRNILDPIAPAFAMHIFSDGFTFITDSLAITYDNTAHSVVGGMATDSLALREAQAIFQVYNEDFVKY